MKRLFNPEERKKMIDGEKRIQIMKEKLLIMIEFFESNTVKDGSTFDTLQFDFNDIVLNNYPDLKNTLTGINDLIIMRRFISRFNKFFIDAALLEQISNIEEEERKKQTVKDNTYKLHTKFSELESIDIILESHVKSKFDEIFKLLNELQPKVRIQEEATTQITGGKKNIGRKRTRKNKKTHTKKHKKSKRQPTKKHRKTRKH